MKTYVFVDDHSSLGGGQLGLLRFLEWGKRSINVALIAFEPGPLVDRARAANVPTSVLGPGGASKGSKRTALEHELVKFGDCVVIANSLGAAQHLALTRRHRGQTWICYLRQEAIPSNAHGLKRLFLSTLAYSRFDRLLANSRWTASTTPRFPGVPRDVTVAFPVSGVEQAIASNSAILAQREPLKLLYMSRLSPWKGADVLVEAMRRIASWGLSHQVSLTIAGGDLFGEPEFGVRLRAAAATTGVDIRFLGHVDETAALLATHHVLLCPSTEPEPFGQVIVQGIANGLVTVGTRQGGAAEIIEDESSGLLVPPGDPDSLAASIRTLIEDPGFYDTLQRGGLARAAEFVDSRTLPALEQALLDAGTPMGLDQPTRTHP